MSDYRRFLGGATELTLPYLGGGFVDGLDRRFRVDDPPAIGWWRFEVTGRVARPVERANPPDLNGRPIVRGHMSGDYLVVEGSLPRRLSLVTEQPQRFAPVIAREWVDDVLLLDALDLESGVESSARRAFDDRSTWDDAGAPSTLRAAFAIDVILRVAVEQGVQVRPLELRPFLGRVPTGGDVAAAEVLREIEEERRITRREQRERLTVDPSTISTDATRPVQSVWRRIDAALSTAGATLLDARDLDQASSVVRYRFLGETYNCLVASDTLRVWDAGICLEGHDDRLSLHSLPSVVREAIARNQLVVTWGD